MHYYRRLVLCCAFWLATAGWAHAADPVLIPWPKSVRLDGQTLSIQASARIVTAEAKLQPLANILSGEIDRLTGTKLPFAAGQGKPGDIVLAFDDSLKGEAYKLDIKDRVTITGGTYRAVVWGTSTLLQLASAGDGKIAVPAGSIADDSDIHFRSAECDIARKWHPIANLYELVDLFSYYKVDHIMLHMNDHGMFTFGTELFPQLAEGKKAVGEKHFYTKRELKDLVAYADARGVTIIPEIEMPGHSDAAGILPNVFGTKDAATGQYKGGPINVLRPDTVEACGKLLNEVLDVFESADFVSIGSDEVNDGAYEKMSEYADFKAKHPNDQPVPYFVNKMNDVAKARGRQLLVYGRGGAMDVMQMPWSGNDNELAAAGYSLITENSGSVTQHLATFHTPPYNTIMLYSGFKGAYEFDIVKDKRIDPANIKQIYGVQTLTWQHWHYMHFFDLRRLMASLSENAWNYQSRAHFLPFEQWRDTRWAVTNQKLDDLVYPVKFAEQGLLSPGKDIVFQGSMTVQLSSRRKGSIRYVKQKLDYMNPPPLPTAQSPIYNGPITFSEPTVLYAALFDDHGVMIGHGTERHYYPITPVILCSAYDGAALAAKVGEDFPNLAQPAATKEHVFALPRTLEDLDKLNAQPTYRFPLGQLTFDPSYEGIYFQGWLLLEQGTIKVPGTNDYEFNLGAGQMSLYIDEKFAASVNGEGKNALRIGDEVTLSAGEHTFKLLAATGSKYPRDLVGVHHVGAGDKDWTPLEQWMLPLRPAETSR